LLGFKLQDIRTTYNLCKISLRDRYLGSTLGTAWAILQPFMLLGLYSAAFTFIFKIPQPGIQSNLEHVCWLICGLVSFFSISDSISAGIGCVVNNSVTVKSVIFNTDVLPFASTMAAWVSFGVGMLFLLTLLIISGNPPGVHILALIPHLIIQFIFLVGLGMFLGATTVFVRDLNQFSPLISTLILFTTPILYPESVLPAGLQSWMFLNPFFHIASAYRDVLIHHRWPDPWAEAYLAGLAVLLFTGGLSYFRRLKGFFETHL
jgi:lipopolysaccharide transport system permease protein